MVVQKCVRISNEVAGKGVMSNITSDEQGVMAMMGYIG